MTGIPDTSRAVLLAAIEDYRVLTPPDQATPDGLTDAIAVYLASSGLTICPDLEP